jgi:dihydropteroate synthase
VAYQIKIRDKTLDLSSPKIMGILNVTPDSFSDGGEFNEREAAIAHIRQMAKEGATIIDVGGESTRPGSEPVSVQEELDRVLPILEVAIPEFPELFFSVDTTKLKVAEEALKMGADIINDVSGLQREPRLVDVCEQYEAAYIMMHSQGDPKTMQEDPHYEDVVQDVSAFFERQIARVRKRGLKERIIIDPGFGFGKTLEHNLKLLANLNIFEKHGLPIMVGISRKSMIGQILNGRPVNERIIGTVAAHYHALITGTNIIRVHDVKQAHDSLKVYQAISQYTESG